jgi:hypothetical protein
MDTNCCINFKGFNKSSHGDPIPVSNRYERKENIKEKEKIN